MHINDLLAQHRAVIRASVEVVARVRTDDLGRPTPCAEWTLAELLAHMTAQHRGFAAAARGNGSDLAAWEVRPLGASPVADYTDAAVDLLAAFASPAPEFELPEFQPVSTFPAAQAISFHLIDYVVHAWDVARSLGLDYVLPAGVADLALRIALLVPDGDNRLAPDSPFAPALTAADEADPLARILTALGRSPEWSRHGQAVRK
ncbi:TIGR03086 family metal-binding protein [Kutzneria chonburiensis]|uniref:TIGR03086 family metal-binding protein n=1 Tax=Kutzneria chonburiensis TaxID=1483604 RepID=A0ABV6MIP7_9PSEU|nr:TIGR03086 family metal-binding protein [Kutzneria chonburiensis]